ncbi:FIST signal transduction protein [Aquabacterium sp. CECT 9606]|uniref:FIST signal transduction protein n=1 Tax=Aquabacterium sp. CECT 9606 TaxID=2845822 RepID=UPI001E5A371F|nr:FIST N-terminal domain-containing protein [Aquabacterium sp. CECT 9606]
MESPAQCVLAFGSPEALQNVEALAQLRMWYPRAHIVGCSTAGEICGMSVQDNTLVATALHFAHTQLRMASAMVGDALDSRQTGAALAAELNTPGLVHVMVLSDGLHVNGTALADGLREHLPAAVAVTGGLAGDGDRFQRTLVCVDDKISEKCVAAIGFYGDRLKVGYGSMGGWDSFGPERLVTRSSGNVLFELDGQPALDLYKRYLGEHAQQLPASALLFPLALRGESIDGSVVRTILAVDEAQGSMTFAGDVPQGTHARLMKANFDRLIDGAAGAARAGLHRLDSFEPELAILISCVGRKLVLKQRVEEEIESVREVLGPQATLAGFYSYGEICPHVSLTKCELHNQTMTVTTFSEQ